jgi:translocator protein
MNKIKLINIITTVIMLVANGLATGLSLGGRTTGQISDSFPVLFTPAGYVFSIWGIIYIGLIGFSIFQILPSQKNNPRLQKLGIWFTLSNLLNTAWIFLWQYGYYTLTAVVMLGLLYSLIVVFLKLDISQKPVNNRENWLVNIPFSIYLGWISVATIANYSVAFFNLGWTGSPLSQETWTIILIGIASLLGMIMAIKERQVPYAMVLIWAFIGINIKQNAYPVVSTTALIGVGAVTAAILIHIGLQMRNTFQARRPLKQAR